jgi:hypothetical protein
MEDIFHPSAEMPLEQLQYLQSFRPLVELAMNYEENLMKFLVMDVERLALQKGYFDLVLYLEELDFD